MSGHHRVKNIEYDDDDDSYFDEDQYDGGEEQAYTSEDRDNFATLSPVVLAELQEAGLDASTDEIEEALWNYYWDVAKSVAYLKTKKTPKQQKQAAGKRAKTPSKFDQAAAKSAQNAGESHASPALPVAGISGIWSGKVRLGRGQHFSTTNVTNNWFEGVPWTDVPHDIAGSLVLIAPYRPSPRLLGGSSKLAKLAEERRKNAAAAKSEKPTEDSTLTALDRLGRPKDANENQPPTVKLEPRRFPIRKKRDPTPPPKEPTPPPAEPEVTLPDLRASPTAFGKAISGKSSSNNEGGRMSLRDLLGAGQNEDAFDGPSPDDKPSSTGLEKKTESLKLEPNSAPPAQTKLKSKGLDVPKVWAEQKSKRKASAAFVVIGHVDHGKSTLMGRLLLDTGAVAQRDIDKYKKKAAEIGKSSFALAWVMDTGDEERERGITVDIAQHHFSTEHVDFTILDAPGHRDFVPNMIGGASMADIAVLVVDANQLASGMKGQTREHVLLAQAVGLRKFVVAVNKLDAANPAWSKKAFEDVRTEVTKYLREIGVEDEAMRFVPCSGLSGENVVKTPRTGPAAWVSTHGPSLLHQLEGSVPEGDGNDQMRKALRMQIADVFRGGVQNPLSVSGRIAQGNLQIGDAVVIQPSGESAGIKGIDVAGEPKEWAVAGQLCTLHLTDIDPQHLRAGDVLCSSIRPVPIVQSMALRVKTLDSLLPQGVDVHLGRLHTSGSIGQLMATVDDDGQPLKRKPRMVKPGQRADVRVDLDSPLPAEPGDIVILRANGGTIAAGVIQPGTK